MLKNVKINLCSSKNVKYLAQYFTKVCYITTFLIWKYYIRIVTLQRKQKSTKTTGGLISFKLKL